MTITIAEAICDIDEFLMVLDNAYWESSKIETKDAIYNVIFSIFEEKSELGKLSIQDHDLPYEAITTGFSKSQKRLEALQGILDQLSLRSKTAEDLDRMIERVSKLLPG